GRRGEIKNAFCGGKTSPDEIPSVLYGMGPSTTRRGRDHPERAGARPGADDHPAAEQGAGHQGPRRRGARRG
ncbi:unnamed protein product, partial [Heterosigma akashiwo]